MPAPTPSGGVVDLKCIYELLWQIKTDLDSLKADVQAIKWQVGAA